MPRKKVTDDVLLDDFLAGQDPPAIAHFRKVDERVVYQVIRASCFVRAKGSMPTQRIGTEASENQEVVEKIEHGGYKMVYDSIEKLAT